MKILVLCGGINAEREVSVNSSENIANALKEKGHSVILLDVFLGSQSAPDFDGNSDISQTAKKIRKMQAEITPEMIRENEFFGPNVLCTCKKADIVFLGLHGEGGEDGKIQATFDLMKIKYTGSGYLGSAIAMSKAYTKKVLENVVPMPRGMIIRKGDTVSAPEYMPCVVKPSNGGSSVGVYIVSSEEEYYPAVKEAFKFDDTVLIERYIDGRELTQGVLNGKPLPVIEIIPKQGFFDYKNKYVAGLTDEICPADITKAQLDEISAYSLAAGEALGLSCCFRLDYRMDAEGHIYLLEANSLPGMTKTSLVPTEASAIGMSFADLCDSIVKISLEKYN